MKIIYISYTGMTDPLGQSQVLPYLAGLRKHEHVIHLISCEKPERLAKLKTDISTFCHDNQINWTPLIYHKHPPVLSTLLDYRRILATATRLIDKEQGSKYIIHCRGYIPTLVGLKLKNKFGARLIFDMRGFWPDEKLENGAWKGFLYKPIYNFFKKQERLFFKYADRVVSLTNVGKNEIIKNNWAEESKIGVIPTCVNFDMFPEFKLSIRTKVREELGIPPDAKVLIYSGSLGGNYDLGIPFKIFENLQNNCENAWFLILSQTPRRKIEDFLEEKQINTRNITFTSTNFSQVHRYLMASDIGLIFYKSGYSNLGRSPTKLGEYWACGLSALVQSKVGDLDFLGQKFPEGAKTFIYHKGTVNLPADSWNIDNSSVKRMEKRAMAKEYFSLENGIAFYHKIYQGLGHSNSEFTHIGKTV